MKPRSPAQVTVSQPIQTMATPCPSFKGEPYAVELFDDIQQTADVFWNLLDEDNRVSLLVKFIHPETSELVIVNKYGSGLKD